MRLSFAPPCGATAFVSAWHSSAPVMPAAKLVMAESAATRRRGSAPGRPPARWTCRPRLPRGRGRRGSRPASRRRGRGTTCRRRDGGDALRRPPPRAAGPHVGVVGPAHADEAGVGRLAGERREAGEVDVILDQHDGAGRHVVAQRAGRVGEDQRRYAERRKRLQGRAHGVRPPRLVSVRAAREHRDRAAREAPDMERPGMARDAVAGKPARSA